MRAPYVTSHCVSFARPSLAVCNNRELIQVVITFSFVKFHLSDVLLSGLLGIHEIISEVAGLLIFPEGHDPFSFV